MTLSDTQGNFLAADGAVGAHPAAWPERPVQHRRGERRRPLTSSTNSVSGYVPGVTLDLNRPAPRRSRSPSARTRRPPSTRQVFVGQFNNTMEKIDDLTKYDPANKTASALTGDSGISDHAAPASPAGQRRRRWAPPASTSNLFSIGVSFGAVGSAVGSTDKPDRRRRRSSRAAIADNPQAVEAVLTSFAATLGAPTDEQHHRRQRYPADPPGRHLPHQGDRRHHRRRRGEVRQARTARRSGPGTGTMAAGQDNYGVIPGLEDHRRRRAHRLARGQLLRSP